MSLYQKASLVQIPSGYKAADAKLYSVVPNSGDGDFTVSSDADATRVNKDGLVETTVANQARLNYDPINPQDPHLLLEPTRLNYTAYSAQFDNSYWTKATSDSTPNPTVTANAGVSPDGGLNADRVQATAAPDNSWAVVKREGINTGATVGSKLQQSLYLKAYDSSQVGKNVDVYMYDFSNTRYYTVYQYTLTADWERVVIEHTIAGANTSTNIQFAFGKARNTVGGSLQSETATDFLVWGGQLEKGDYPTSYIPTSGSAVTRTVDTCINGGDANLFNDTEGVLFLDVEIPNNSSEVKQTSLNNGTTNEVVKILQLNGTTFRFEVGMSSGTNFSQDITVSPYQRNKLALQYKANDYKVFVNGEKQSVTQRSTSPTGLDRFNFNRGFSTTDDFSGKVNQLMIFNEALSDAELTTLTS